MSSVAPLRTASVNDTDRRVNAGSGITCRSNGSETFVFNLFEGTMVFSVI